jgi:hypothetical protein
MTTPRLTVPPSVVTRAVGGEVLLLNADTGRYYTLDPTGARVWALIASLETTDRVCDALAAEFQADPQELRRDVEALVSDLIAQGLLESIHD